MPLVASVPVLQRIQETECTQAERPMVSRRRAWESRRTDGLDLVQPNKRTEDWDT